MAGWIQKVTWFLLQLKLAKVRQQSHKSERKLERTLNSCLSAYLVNDFLNKNFFYCPICKQKSSILERSTTEQKHNSYWIKAKGNIWACKQEKRQGMEKKVLDELAEAWESSNQTIHKRHRLLLGPSFAEVNFKKNHSDHINSSFLNYCLISWYWSIFSNSFLSFFICCLQHILGLKDKRKSMKKFIDDFTREKDVLVPLFLKKCQSEKLKTAKMVIAFSIQQNKNKHFKQNTIF